MRTDALSPFSFYGGKAGMARIISEMLDYHAEIYIEPYGGACRTLLNKPRHGVEIYNDSSLGLCAFMNLMSREDTARELIRRIYETEYSRESFHNALKYKNSFDVDVSKQLQNEFESELKHLLIKYNVISQTNAYNEFREAMRNHENTVRILLPQCSKDEIRLLMRSVEGYEESVKIERNLETDLRRRLVKCEVMSGINDDDKFALFMRDYEKNIDDLKTTKKNEEIKESDKNALRQSARKYVLNINRGFDLPEQWNGVSTANYLDNYDLAVFTYIVYAQSRDGMGEYWSSVKYKSQDVYIKQMDRLYDVAERMNGVLVPGALDALVFLKYSKFLNDSNAIYYLDPAYISVDEEKDLGKTYKTSYTKSDHIVLLETICEAKAKILFSNYDAPVFSEYLTPERGWKRYEHETKTSLGRNGEKDRLEVLWYNY